MEKKLLYVAVEEHLNNRLVSHQGAPVVHTPPVSPELRPLIGLIDRQLEKRPSAPEPTLYEDVIHYLKRLNDPDYMRKNGGIKEAAFYQRACIDKSTWSDMKQDRIVPKKKTLLKLAVALHLSADEAEALLAKGHNAFDPDDIQDQIILTLLRAGYYDIQGVMEILAYYQEVTPKGFDSIYDTSEDIADRRKGTGR